MLLRAAGGHTLVNTADQKSAADRHPLLNHKYAFQRADPEEAEFWAHHVTVVISCKVMVIDTGSLRVHSGEQRWGGHASLPNHVSLLLVWLRILSRNE